MVRFKTLSQPSFIMNRQVVELGLSQVEGRDECLDLDDELVGCSGVGQDHDSVVCVERVNYAAHVISDALLYGLAPHSYFSISLSLSFLSENEELVSFCTESILVQTFVVVRISRLCPQ